MEGFLAREDRVGVEYWETLSATGMVMGWIGWNGAQKLGCRGYMNGPGEKDQAWTGSGVGEEGTDQGFGDSWEWAV